MSLANIVIVGRLGRDPEFKVATSGNRYATFSLAVSNRRRETVTWYACSCFGRLAETVDKLAQSGAMVKGREVAVTGTFEPREYETGTGVGKRWSFDVACDNMQLIGARDSGEQPKAGDYDDLPF